jgi:hypothetical protein
VSTALAADTLSITLMEVIDNVVVVLVPGARTRASMGPGSTPASAGFAVLPLRFLVNRCMIARRKGHAFVHTYHH